MKKVLAVLLAMVLAIGCLAACSGSKPADNKQETKKEEGKVFNIYAWNEEFKGFFEKYYTVPEGITVNWIINPSDNGVYQDKLDEALSKQDSAAADDKVDMFLAEADYIMKYADSKYTQDIKAIGVTDFSQMYSYTLDAAAASDGTNKGVSFQACPSALIYRRSIAKDVLGTDDPVQVQEKLSTWAKFDAEAANAKAKGYYMTASFAETYRVYSNNCTSAWVDSNKKLQLDANLKAWVDQTKAHSENKYTIASAGIWDAEKNDQMFADGKTMCFFGPAWYFNFCMGNAMDPDKGCSGDWAICQGPQAHFWGGTWIMAPAGTDNPTMLADIMKAFTVNEGILEKLVSVEGQFPNNKKVVDKFAKDASYGSAFLGGQNDIAEFAKMTDNIVWKYHTNYDQILNEGFQDKMKPYFLGEKSYDECYKEFLVFVNEKYPAIVTE